MLAQHNQLHPDDRGINLSKDPPDQYQCLKHRKKELPSTGAGPVPRKFDKHNAANNGRIRFEMWLLPFPATAIEGSSFFLCFKH